MVRNKFVPTDIGIYRRQIRKNVPFSVVAMGCRAKVEAYNKAFKEKAEANSIKSAKLSRLRAIEAFCSVPLSRAYFAPPKVSIIARVYSYLVNLFLNVNMNPKENN